MHIKTLANILRKNMTLTFKIEKAKEKIKKGSIIEMNFHKDA